MILNNHLKINVSKSKEKLWRLVFWGLLIVQNILLYYDDGVPWYATIIENSSFVLIAVFPYYYTGRKLVPKYLKRGKYFIFYLKIFVLVSLASIIYLWIFFFYYLIYYRSILDTYFQNTPIKDSLIHFSIIFWTYMIPVAISVFVQLYTDRTKSGFKLETIKHEKYLVELNYLKNQINPHFLFNILNTIYFLISKDNNKARDLLEVSSEMLRYRLYQSQEKLIPLTLELDYVESYIKIVKNFKKIDCELKTNIDGNIDEVYIPPLILANCVEYVIEYLPVNSKCLYLNISSKPQYIAFEFKNFTDIFPNDLDTYTTTSQEVVDMKEKLELLFPSRHLFESFRDKNQIYTKITLYHENKTLLYEADKLSYS